MRNNNHSKPGLQHNAPHFIICTAKTRICFHFRRTNLSIDWTAARAAAVATTAPDTAAATAGTTVGAAAPAAAADETKGGATAAAATAATTTPIRKKHNKENAQMGNPAHEGRSPR